MSSYVNSPTHSFTGGAVLELGRCVKKSGGKVVYAGAADEHIGTMEIRCEGDGQPATVRLRTAQGTVMMSCAGNISDGAEVFSAANGQITATPGTISRGFANQAGAANDLIEVIPR